MNWKTKEERKGGKKKNNKKKIPLLAKEHANELPEDLTVTGKCRHLCLHAVSYATHLSAVTCRA